MAVTTKKQTALAEYEAEFLERKLVELEQYIDARPFQELKDRIEWKQTKSGGMLPMVIASIEAQRKDIAQAMIDYADIAARVRKLREEEEAKKQKNAKGGSEIPWAMRKNK